MDLPCAGGVTNKFVHGVIKEGILPMSCLFETLSLYVPCNSTHLRKQICDFTHENPLLDELNIRCDEYIKYESRMTLREYVDRMRRPSAWGGALEIRLFCKLYNRRVVVYSATNNRKIRFEHSDVKKTIPMVWTGNHYRPLSRLEMQSMKEKREVRVHDEC